MDEEIKQLQETLSKKKNDLQQIEEQQAKLQAQK